MGRVLIVGGGMAGDALAVMLGRAGWDVTVAELAGGVRSGGQTVDLRGPSTAVLDRLGLLGAARARLVTQRGIAWVDRDGRDLGRMPVEAFAGAGFVSEFELLRLDLAQLLHDAARLTAELRFGETVEQVQERCDGVEVVFRSGGTSRFDLVVGADGTHSRVRELTHGAESLFRRPLGLAHAWYTLHESDGTPELDGWWLTHNALDRRTVEARPGHSGQQEIGFSFAAHELPDRRDKAAQVELLHRRFAGVGWRAPELLQHASTAEDFAMDTFDQIRVPAWHTERTVLLGDAAWCASPLSGLGTALALAGADALAASLGAPGPAGAAPTAALVAFERAFRPTVEAAQKLIPGRVRMYAPRTRIGSRATIATYRAAQSAPISALLTRAAARYGHDQDSASLATAGR